jgi:hypothetical protein
MCLLLFTCLNDDVKICFWGFGKYAPILENCFQLNMLFGNKLVTFINLKEIMKETKDINFTLSPDIYLKLEKYVAKHEFPTAEVIRVTLNEFFVFGPLLEEEKKTNMGYH